MSLTTYKWSIEEWHDLVDSGVLAGKKVELLEGEIIAISLKNNKLIVHTQPQANSYAQIVEYKAGTVSPLAFPQIAIVLDKLLLY
jgi:hypothetical protein